jgi:hypothetical protein
MSLDQIGKASIGQPGKVAPPCPDAETVTRLKGAHIPIGPCDPLPERGQVVIVPDRNLEQPTPSNQPVCAHVTVRSAVGLRGTLPCVAGARFLDATAVQREGAWCLRATYVPGLGVGDVVDTVCDGDHPNADGLDVTITPGK